MATRTVRQDLRLLGISAGVGPLIGVGLTTAGIAVALVLRGEDLGDLPSAMAFVLPIAYLLGIVPALFSGGLNVLAARLDAHRVVRFIVAVAGGAIAGPAFLLLVIVPGAMFNPAQGGPVLALLAASGAVASPLCLFLSERGPARSAA